MANIFSNKDKESRDRIIDSIVSSPSGPNMVRAYLNNPDKLPAVDIKNNLVDFFIKKPAEGAEILRDYLAGKIAPERGAIFEEAKKSEGLPYGKILARTAAETAAEFVPMTPTDFAFWAAAGKAIPAAGKFVANKFPEFAAAAKTPITNALRGKWWTTADVTVSKEISALAKMQQSSKAKPTDTSAKLDKLLFIKDQLKDLKPAIRTSDGMVFEGDTHPDALIKALDSGEIIEKGGQLLNKAGEKIGIDADLFRLKTGDLIKRYPIDSGKPGAPQQIGDVWEARNTLRGRQRAPQPSPVSASLPQGEQVPSATLKPQAASLPEAVLTEDSNSFFPVRRGSYTESISRKPDFVNASNTASEFIKEQSIADKTEVTPKYLQSLYDKFHDLTQGWQRLATEAEQSKYIEDMLKKYPGISKKYAALRSMMTLEKTPDNLKDMVYKTMFEGKYSTPEIQPSFKPKKFIETVKESPVTRPGLVRELESRQTSYEPITNKETLDFANNIIKESPEKALAFVMESGETSARHTATASELIKKYQAEGNFKSAADVADMMATKLTRAGQTIQAAKLYSNLSPEGILVKAQKLISDVNKNRFPWQKDIKLDETTSKELYDLATKMKGATGDLKLELSEEIQSILSSISPSDPLRKISTLQTVGQLLNPKTIVRNMLGNELFYRLERLNKYVATPIDWARSKITGGERTITFKDQGQGGYWKAFLKGARSGWKGTTPEGVGTQFEIYNPAFKSKYNPFTYLEKAMGVSLKSGDFAAYTRAKNQTIGELSYLMAYNQGYRGQQLKQIAASYAKNADDNILKIAKDYGKYITFQDYNVLSKSFSGIKKALNFGKGFGFGDLVLKYPKTPAALMMRGIEYSPAGFLRSAYLVARPFIKGGEPTTREATLALSRAITGTLGLTGLGYYLADKGILTAEKEKSRNISAIERQAGVGPYKLNYTALRRWVKSGFRDSVTERKPGDKFFTYDWAQPVALSLALGANMNKGAREASVKESKYGNFAELPGQFSSSITSAVETLTGQPLMAGLTRAFSAQAPAESIKSSLKELPTSFIPTLSSQFRKKKDIYVRETYSPKLIENVVNKIKNKIPYLSEKLPTKYDVFGKPIESIENPSNYNIFLNPGFVSTYKPTGAAKIVLDIYKETGETKQAPKVVPRELTFYGKKYKLTGRQVSNFQKNLGENTEKIFSKIAQDKGFLKLPNEEKATLLNRLLDGIYKMEKLKALSKEQLRQVILDAEQSEGRR